MIYEFLCLHCPFCGDEVADFDDSYMHGLRKREDSTMIYSDKGKTVYIFCGACRNRWKAVRVQKRKNDAADSEKL